MYGCVLYDTLRIIVATMRFLPVRLSFAIVSVRKNGKGQENMMKREKDLFRRGILLLLLFGIWTFLICSVDVQIVEETGTKVGFFAWNHWFHDLTGVHMTLYAATDWLGLVPVLVCACFAGSGLCQLIKRKHICLVDVDILILGAYYIVVALSYLLFETVPIN